MTLRIKRQQLPLTPMTGDKVIHLNLRFNTQNPSNFEVLVVHDGQDTEVLAQMIACFRSTKKNEDSNAYNNTISIPQTTDSRVLEFVYKAQDLLLADLQQPPSLKQIAHQVGTNPTKLSKVFQQHFGMTMFDYLHEHRLIQEQHLLRQTSLPIQQIADNIGYKNHCDFSVAFKRRFGLTPRQYRCQFYV